MKSHEKATGKLLPIECGDLFAFFGGRLDGAILPRRMDNEGWEVPAV